MEFTGILNSYIYITASFLNLELCFCILLDRGLRDRIDFLNGENCHSVTNSDVSDDRCRCRPDDGTLGSNNKNKIICFGPDGLDGDYEFKYSPANTSVRVAKALPNCNYQPIITEFWNLENDTSGPNMVRGIWQINNYIETYIKLQSNFIVLENPGNLFTGMLLSMKFACSQRKWIIFKIYGSRNYPISTNSIRPFSTTTKTPPTTTATTETRNREGNKYQSSASTKNTRSNRPITQNSTSITDKKNESSTVPRNTSSNIPNAHTSSKEDSKNVVTIAVVASLVTMINIILSICLIKRLRQKHKNGEYKVDNPREQMKGQIDEPIYAEANNNFLKEGSPKKEHNDPNDRQKFVAARINLQKSRAYQNFTNENMEHEDSQTDLPDYDEPENNFQMIRRYENFPLEETPKEQVKVETQPRYVNQDLHVAKNDGYVTMKPCTAEETPEEQVKVETQPRYVNQDLNVVKNDVYVITKLCTAGSNSTEQKPEYSELTAQVHGKTLLYTRLSINNPASTEEPYYRCVDEPEMEESPPSCSDIYYHSVEVENTTSDEPKSDYTDLDPQYQYKHQEYTDLCLDNLAFIEEPVYRCVDESD